jgi:anti-sigma B factor antagonist
MPLKVTVVKKQEGVFMVAPLGSVDSTTYTELDAKIKSVLTPALKVLVLNMAGVGYITSMGISVVFKAKKAVEEKGGTFMMTDLQPQIKQVFEIIKALPTMSVFASIEEADEYLAEMQRREIEKRRGGQA